MVPVRGSCDATYDVAFKIHHSVELNKIIEATVPVNPYNNRTVADCLRTEASWKGRYEHLTVTVSSLQAKCKLGITNKKNIRTY